MIKHIKPTNRVIYNKGMGWTMHTSIDKNHMDYNELFSYDGISAVALLSCWADIEKVEGVYDFKDLDDAIMKWEKLGMEIHFRISTDPMIYNNKALGAPMWLFHKYKIPYQIKQVYGLDAYYPDYLDPIFQEKMFQFVEALSKRYYQNPNVVQMDLRGYGEWGEWHSGYMYNTIAKRVLALRSIIDIWREANQGRIPLVLSGSYEWRNDLPNRLHAPKNYKTFLYQSAFDYALRFEDITFRRDGIGGALKTYDFLLFQDYFYHHAKLPLTTEFFTAYNKTKPFYVEDKDVIRYGNQNTNDSIKNEDGVRGYFAEDALEEALMMHPNYMMLMWDSRAFHEERKDLIEHGQNRMGYRLYPSEIDYELTENNLLEIKMTWKNEAVGRLYENHIIEFKLIDQDNQTVYIEDKGVSLKTVIEDHPFTHHVILDLGELKKKIKIFVGIKLLKSNHYIELALDQKHEDHFYLFEV